MFKMFAEALGLACETPQEQARVGAIAMVTLLTAWVWNTVFFASLVGWHGEGAARVLVATGYGPAVLSVAGLAVLIALHRFASTPAR